MRTPHGWLTALLCLLSLTMAGAQESRFPNPDPDPRVGTPNDPDFDCAEPDDEDAGTVERCDTVFNEQFRLFGFAPASTRTMTIYRDADRLGQGQVSGVSADLAWKISTGSPQIVVAILDTGIRWENQQMRKKVWLNHRELPCPQAASGCPNAAALYDGKDADGDGAFTVDDYAGDARVTDGNANELLDGQDLIRAFSDGSDADANGYVDDIAGWDFLDDDNDPEDTSSYSAAGNHGTGRAREAVEETNEGFSKASVCPQCRGMMLREWDTFVVPGDNYAAATVYLADNGAHVQEVANGVMTNSRSALLANRYAFEKGVALMQVSSDLNTADHNFPTNYVESVYINGCIPDTYGASNEFFGALDPAAAVLGPVLNLLRTIFGLGGASPPEFPPVGTYFRSSNLTQFGAHAHVCYMADTGSNATGQAAGGAGLIHSRGLELAGQIGGPLTSNEVKQILTLTAEDVTPENVLGIGTPDPSQVGWDEYFGYGRAHLGDALARVAPGTIPPEALIRSPAWWAMLDPVEPARVAGVAPEIRGLARARRSSGCSYRLEWAAGIQPPDDGFSEFASGACPADANGLLGALPMAAIADAIPGAREGTPNTDYNHHAFSVRLVVEDAEGNRGEDRKVYFAIHDPTWHAGWPIFADTGGETSLMLYDLDGDGAQEVIDANSSGELHVLRHDGTPLPSFNGGQAWRLPPARFFHPGAPGFVSGAVPAITSGLRTPSIADVDGDLEPEIVVASGQGDIYVLSATGAVERTLSVDLSLSEPADRTRERHPKAGFSGSPVLADLEGDGAWEIIAAALDGYLYVWEAATGAARAGFPLHLADPAVGEEGFFGGEIIATPAVGDLDGDGDLEIVSGTNEVYGPLTPGLPSSPGTIEGAIQGLVTNLLANALGGSSRVYAVQHDGTFAAGWPVTLNGILPDVLPFVGPQHAVAIGDVDGDGDDEVVASITTGDVHVLQGDGTATAFNSVGVAVGAPSAIQPSKFLNLFEYPIVGDLDGAGGLDIVKGGISVTAILNLLLVGQNLPQAHVVQAWDSARPSAYLPGWPTVTDDFQLLSTPAMADADGDGASEVLVGTGLYLLHAYDATGMEAAGFPKLAGGWLFNTPAVGDVDGDGQLEIAAGTREGWRFVWDLDAPAAIGQWPMEGHDPCHSNNHGMDCQPPGKVRALAFRDGALQFVASGDDGWLGQADRYELRTLERPIAGGADWNAARALPGVTVSAAAGALESIALAKGESRGHVAVIAVDEAGNRGRPVSVPVGAGEGAEAAFGSGGGAPAASLLVWLLAAAGLRRRTRSR